MLWALGLALLEEHPDEQVKEVQTSPAEDPHEEVGRVRNVEDLSGGRHPNPNP